MNSFVFRLTRMSHFLQSSKNTLYFHGRGLHRREKNQYSKITKTEYTSMAESTQATWFQGREDAYGGFIIDSSSIPSTVEDFESQLSSSLEYWKHERQYRGIWLKLHRQHQHHLISPACTKGFKFHHAEKDYIMMTQWLPKDVPSTLPPNASHQIGVGAFVYDAASGQVLVVQEKNGPLKGMGVWKMPTGLVNEGEDITEAAVREVEEETQVKVTFQSVLSLRQSHGFAFGKSDLFFVVACAVDFSAYEGIQHVDEIVLTPQESEIERCSWIPLDEFVGIEFMRSRPLYRQIMDTCYAYAQGRYRGLSGAKLASRSEKEDLLLFSELVQEEEDVSTASPDQGTQDKGGGGDRWIGIS